MMAKMVALVLLSQIAADGLTVDRGIPRDLETWRWTLHAGRAVLGWGKINEAGFFVPTFPRPEWPLFPGSEIKPVEGVPLYAVNGVTSQKLPGSGLTLQASDPETAEEAKQALQQLNSASGASKGPLFPPLKLGPDWAEIGLLAVGASMFALSGAILLQSIIRRPPRE